MGNIKAFSKRQRWSDEEVAILRTAYATASRSQRRDLFPSRRVQNVETKAHLLGLAKPPKTGMTEAETRKSKREAMARRRATDPDAAKAYGRSYTENNRVAVMKRLKAYCYRRFFWNKSMKLRGKDRATGKDLTKLWKSQKGRCALTGRRLDRSAQLDHITPIARGGDDTTMNLQWLCKHANLAKRDLTDSEFINLCHEVVAHANLSTP